MATQQLATLVGPILAVSILGCGGNSTPIKGVVNGPTTVAEATQQLMAQSGSGAAPRVVTYADIAPILAMHCNSCHGPPDDFDWWMSGFKSREHIDTRSYRALISDTDVGTIVTSGKPDESRLYTVLLEKDEANRMPLFGTELSDAEKETIRRWILDGAHDGVEQPALTMRVPVHRTHAKPPVTEQQLDNFYDACVDSAAASGRRPQDIPTCKTFDTHLQEYRAWLAVNVVEVSCKIDSEAYVELAFLGEGHELKKRVATFKESRDYGDAHEFKDWHTWREAPPQEWPSDFVVELTIRYWQPKHPAVFALSVGDMPEEARKIDFAPNPVHGSDKGRLTLWLASRSDVKVSVLRNFVTAPARTFAFHDLAEGKNDLDVNVGMRVGGGVAGLYTVLVEVTPRTQSDGAYSGAVAVWLD